MSQFANHQENCEKYLYMIERIRNNAYAWSQGKSHKITIYERKICYRKVLKEIYVDRYDGKDSLTLSKAVKLAEEFISGYLKYRK